MTGFVDLNQNYVDIWGTTIYTVRSVSLMGQRGQIMVNRAYNQIYVNFAYSTSFRIEFRNTHCSRHLPIEQANYICESIE